MSLNNNVACPMDCYDSCQGQMENDSIKGSKEHSVTKGKLCVNFANLLKQENLKSALFEGEKIPLNNAVEMLVEKLKITPPEKTLFYKGSGNLGIMQSSTKNFFGKYGATLTKGSLCDGPGSQGIEDGRGKVTNPPIQRLIDSDVIIVWGRNFSVTSPHLYNLIKDKTFITIDPVKTDIAKKSELHLQINPKTDHELALMLTRVTYMNRLDDEEYLEENSSGHDWFFDIAKNRPLVSYEYTTGVELNNVYKLFDIIDGKKVSLVIGLGVQKYFEGAQIIRTIDSFATFSGIHNQENAGGVWYLSDSNYGYEKPFSYKGKNKKVSLPKVDFGNFDLVFIQGANPVVSAPNTKKVIEGLEKSFVVYFGITYNDTCKYADLVIPSCSFLSKKDIRLSYGHEFKAISDVVKEKEENSLSEYELAQILNERFDFDKFLSEDEIIEKLLKTEVEYEGPFDEFEFIEDVEIEPLYKNKTSENFYLITAKNKTSLNSQFANDDFVYLNSSSNFSDGNVVNISSRYGMASFEVRINDDIKSGCAFFFAGNKKVNYLTPNDEDEFANSAMYQEVLLEIELS